MSPQSVSTGKCFLTTSQLALNSSLLSMNDCNMTTKAFLRGEKSVANIALKLLSHISFNSIKWLASFFVALQITLAVKLVSTKLALLKEGMSLLMTGFTVGVGIHLVTVSALETCNIGIFGYSMEEKHVAS